MRKMNKMNQIATFACIGLLTGCAGFLPPSQEQREKNFDNWKAEHERPREERETSFQASLSKMKVERERERRQRVQAYLESHRNVSDEVRAALETGKIWIGMDTDQLEAVMGKPQSKNITQNARFTHEQWVFGDSTYVYVDDGKVSSWQFSEQRQNP